MVQAGAGWSRKKNIAKVKTGEKSILKPGICSNPEKYVCTKTIQMSESKHICFVHPNQYGLGYTYCIWVSVPPSTHPQTHMQISRNRVGFPSLHDRITETSYSSRGQEEELYQVRVWDNCQWGWGTKYSVCHTAFWYYRFTSYILYKVFNCFSQHQLLVLPTMKLASSTAHFQLLHFW